MAARLRPGDVVALTGEIGAGKTCLTRGLARGVGATTAARSPTFVLMHRHELDGASHVLYHLDLYRLDSADELEDIGGADVLHGDDICVVEWAERADDLLPADVFRVHIECLDGDARRLTVTGPRRLLPDD
ncbi:tRNA (adenosine(37)-N6)-threonylcarbamoyltransferase complex ATPase subunit type 1 TsaE [Candidatus Poribacteria bacterium]|nr:tRNA (adenosine(37)-N6)-threonylcarbamoyltransferase complex ATPase subunit type 1 TsaE [Candidatus Poribacteria bacterium]